LPELRRRGFRGSAAEGLERARRTAGEDGHILIIGRLATAAEMNNAS
jgi:hypothetical protein